MICLFCLFWSSFVFWGPILFSSIGFMILDNSLMIESEFMSLHSSVMCMALLFDWMPLLFISFILFISSVVISMVMNM